ncbi:hypothetical protein QC762_114715 [Podospora pseudocomata]|uniref:Uncharacterized protein n=1 Tax=Podospora pseudocomata TaxID=2093779 RepID=A0ABR0GW07_9PEZI|nr:hypothetical protein QC762_114715 [Podospora pseudocomata]
MSSTYSSFPDDHHRPSDASLSDAWYSDDDDETATSARPTHRTSMTAYSDDAIMPRYVDSTYTNQQPPLSLAGPPYPNNYHEADESMGMNHQPYAFRWMTGDGPADEDPNMMGSLEALPSTTPPQHVPQELRTDIDSHRTNEMFEAEHTRKGGSKQRQTGDAFEVNHTSSFEPGAAKFGTDTTFQEAEGRFSQSPDDVSPLIYAPGMTTHHNFPYPYPARIHENDLPEPQSTTRFEGTDWEFVDSQCAHGYWEHCPYCPSQRFASSRY